MNDFKEWLSDYLRYFLLILAALLMIALAVIGVRVYKAVTNPASDSDDAIEILHETERISETESETETETKKSAEAESEPDSKKVSEKTAETDKGESESAAVSEKMPESRSETADTAIPGETELPIAIETESETEAPYEPVYMTLKGSCYIRSGPSMEADIIGEYMYGTTVEFLEDAGGWYKVQIDGMVGYMGARFF